MDSIPNADALKALPKAALAGLACEAAAGGDLEGAKALIEAGVSMAVGTPYDNRTPLHLAAAAGNLKMVRFLIEEAGVKMECDRFGLTPINDAVHNEHVEVRRYLQSKRLERHRSVVGSRSLRARSDSCDSTVALDLAAQNEAQDEIMSTVFELVVKEGIFSYTTIFSEVQYFFRSLGLHPMYFEHFTPLQIAKHVHCLIAAKRVAQATDDMDRMDFVLTTGRSGFFLTTIDQPQPTDAQKRTEAKISKHLDEIWLGRSNASLTFMSSEGPAVKGGIEKLGMFTTEVGNWEAVRFSEGETSLEVLASSKFLKEKTRRAKEHYQIVMEDVVASRRAVVRIVPGIQYPGPYPGGFVVQFGTPETVGRHYFTEICQALRFCGLIPRRFYLETFMNGVITYALFFPWAKEDEVNRLGRTIMVSTHLNFTGKEDIIYKSVMQAKISFEVGLYVSAAVKFVYMFFPKEQYAPEYTHVHGVLQNDPGAQRKLEALYRLCMRDLLSTQRIFDLLRRQLDLAVRFFEDFQAIALGRAPPRFNSDLAAAIEKACPEQQDRQILKMFLTFNESILLTNFFKAGTPSAFAFRLDPRVVLKGRPTSLYPEIPFGIYLVTGRNFLGFHVRFLDVARGGIRLVLSREKMAHDRNKATLFNECYNLALTQHLKNKDIPEGGGQGVILPDPTHLFVKKSEPNAKGSNHPIVENSALTPAAQVSCFTRYLDALLDCMMPEQSGIYNGHMGDRREILYFGPDENTANFMDLGAELAKGRGYPYWKALTTGKSVKLGGVPHDMYGMTTASTHTYVKELLKELGEEESSITKFMTGGPDGDLGSNEILASCDKTIAIVDRSGVLYDPAGLNREELVRLARRRRVVKDFNRGCLSKGGFFVSCDDSDFTLPDGSKWRTGTDFRDRFHLTHYSTADLFMPCGGRPGSVTTESVRHLFGPDGTRPRFRMIVEGANLFFSDGARHVLEKAGVHIFKDASTNKGGVISSSLEVFSALALKEKDHSALMTYNPLCDSTEPPEFYTTYVQQIMDIIVVCAQQEFRAIWLCNQRDGVPKVEATQRLSVKVNKICDTIQQQLRTGMMPHERDALIRNVLLQAVPPLMIERLGIDGILANVPENYVGSIVGAWVASRFVYKHGIDASEVGFFFFMRSLIGDASPGSPGNGRENGDGAPRKRAAAEFDGSVEAPAEARPRLA